MKRKTSFIILITLLTIFTGCLTGCGSKNSIIGQWQEADGDTFVFFEDNTGFFVMEKGMYSDINYYFTWTTNGGKLSLDYENEQVYDTSLPYELSGNTLKLKGENSEEVYHRINDSKYEF